jgi:hypothetical protein
MPKVRCNPSNENIWFMRRSMGKNTFYLLFGEDLLELENSFSFNNLFLFGGMIGMIKIFKIMLCKVLITSC